MKGALGMFFVAAMGLLANQAHAASVTIIHGINGLDLGLARELPVDIAVNGKCALKGVTFTGSTQVALDKGSYRVTVHPANGSCSAKAVIDQTLTIDSSNDYASLSVIASLTETGSPRLAVYNNNTNMGLGNGIGVRHVAFAPPVYAKADIVGVTSRAPKLIKNGDAGEVNINWVTSVPYKVTVSTGKRSGVLARLQGKFRNSRVTWRIFHIVGSLKNGLEIVTQDVTPSELAPKK